MSSSAPGSGSDSGSGSGSGAGSHSHDSQAASSTSLRTIAIRFLIIGATTFGGGVVAYLRALLVDRMKWLTPDEFMAELETSQTLPGLNATNMAVLTGGRLRGGVGAVVAFAAILLPGAITVYVLGMVAKSVSSPLIIGALAGVAAASIGLLSGVVFKVGLGMFRHVKDVSVIAATVILGAVLKLPLILVLLIMVPISIYLYRPSRKALDVHRSNQSKPPSARVPLHPHLSLVRSAEHALEKVVDRG